jgi:hypothetical protein
VAENLQDVEFPMRINDGLRSNVTAIMVVQYTHFLVKVDSSILDVCIYIYNLHIKEICVSI